jgi:hypothetical protein
MHISWFRLCKREANKLRSGHDLPFHSSFNTAVQSKLRDLLVWMLEPPWMAIHGIPSTAQVPLNT